jgi:hypothetical protein
MIPKLTEDQRHAINEHGGAPIFLIDDATNVSYVLIRADQFEKIKVSTDNEDVASMYSLLADVSPEDWEDAANYEPRT